MMLMDNGDGVSIGQDMPSNNQCNDVDALMTVDVDEVMTVDVDEVMTVDVDEVMMVNVNQ